MAIATINPATGKTLKTFEPLSSQEIERKISRAAKLFPEFSRLSFAERATMMLKAAEILETEKRELAQLMTTEMGKTLRSAVDEPLMQLGHADIMRRMPSDFLPMKSSKPRLRGVLCATSRSALFSWSCRGTIHSGRSSGLSRQG
jgi:acyl-CoA reductase-like NAD-dependent aldehyde dehydrogenase